MNTINSLQEIAKSTIGGMIPGVITTNTTTDFVPEMSKLTIPDESTSDEIIPTLAKSALTQTATKLKKKDIQFVDKEFSKLTINQIYDNTIKTIVSIINDISELISEKEVLTNTEFRRKLFQIFLLKERRMYVGILLVVFSFILYFIDSST